MPGQEKEWPYGTRVRTAGKDEPTVMGAAAKLCSGGGIDGCVNARVAPDRRLGDMADEDMNQVADIEFKHCKLTVHACNSVVAPNLPSPWTPADGRR